MKTIDSSYRGKFRAIRERGKTISGAALFGALLLSSVSVALAQVYGVRRTAVVRGPNTTVVASRTTVVAGGTALPHGTRSWSDG